MRSVGHPAAVALVPAHNEEERLPDALYSLTRQSRPPTRVVVVTDNCTDDTAEVARRAGADTLTTVQNTHKKTGALNQSVHRLVGDSSTTQGGTS